MKLLNAIDKGKVFMTSTIDKVYTWENVSPLHILAYIFSGELTLSFGKNTLTFVAGDTVLVPKNQLSRSVKKPINGEPFKCMSMLLSHPLLDSFFSSLLPYFDMQDELPDELVSIKIQEALTIIDVVDKRASSILGTFNEIGKIDLEKYMEDHFMYNLPLERFAFLTGRSLTTFKSDFKKIFKTTPGKWLTEKRLNLAHHKLNAEKQKTTDVYHSVGFENLSHFSFAFKKAFGYSPSTIKSKEHSTG